MILLERFILRSQIERERTRIAFSGKQRRFAGNDEGKARHALNALIGRGNQKINAESLHRDFHPAEAAHGIHDEQAVFRLYDAGHTFDVVENTRRRFAVHHRDHRRFGVRIQPLGNSLNIRRLIPAAVNAVKRNAVISQNLAHAL